MDFIDWLKLNRNDFEKALKNAEEQKKQFLEHIRNVLDPDIQKYTNYLKQSQSAIIVLEVLNDYKPENQEENLG
jgi:hypothetical protein